MTCYSSLQLIIYYKAAPGYIPWYTAARQYMVLLYLVRNKESLNGRQHLREAHYNLAPKTGHV